MRWFDALFKLSNDHVRFKKRRLVVFLITLLIISMLSLGVLGTLGIFGTGAELCMIKIQDSNTPLQTMSGYGINLDYIPDVNIINDPSFENSIDYEMLSVADSSDNTVFFDTEAVRTNGVNLDNVIGSDMTILSIDENGVMSTSLQASVSGYSQARFGSFSQLADENWLWSQSEVIDIEYIDNSVVALSRDGKIFTDITNGQLSKVYGDEETFFTHIARSENAINAITSRGDIYVSVDGKTFSLQASATSEPSYEDVLASDSVTVTSFAACNNTQIAVLSDGSYMVCTGSNMTYSTQMYSQSVSFVTATNTTIYIALDDGSVYESMNGLVYSYNEEISDITSEVYASNSRFSIISTSKSELSFYLETGALFVVGKNTTDGTYIDEYDVSVSLSDVVILENNSIVLVDEFGTCYLLNRDTNESTILTNQGSEVTRLFAAPNNKVIARRNYTLSTSSIYVALEIDQTIGEQQVHSGDICYLSFLHENICWEVYGEDSLLGYVNEGSDATSESGNAETSARLIGASNGLHFISQQLDGTGADLFTEDSFLRIELSLRQNHIQDGVVKVWLSCEDFDDIGFVIENCSDKMTSYSNVFAVNSQMLNATSPIRLNIAFEGQGELFVDSVYLGLDRYSSDNSLIPDAFREGLISTRPSAIRLNNLDFGRDGAGNDTIYEVGTLVEAGKSLEESLGLVRDCQSNPWLVLSANTDAATVNVLLEYLCGSVSSEYGKLRTDNGTALPWGRQFETIYIEINDAGGNFSSDIQRSSYVNYVIGLISQSEYYLEIKDRLVLLDGMHYEGGVMLSGADHHCSDLGLILSSLSEMNMQYAEANYSSPRVPGEYGNAGEYIRSATFAQMMNSELTDDEAILTVSAGQWATAFLSSESYYTAMTLINIEASHYPASYEDGFGFVVEGRTTVQREVFANNEQTKLNVLGILDVIRGSNRIASEVSMPLSSDPDFDPELVLSEFNQNVGVYLFENSTSYTLIVTNPSSEQQQFAMDGIDLSLNGAVLERYSASGELIRTSELTNRIRRHTLQAGEIMIVVVNK